MSRIRGFLASALLGLTVGSTAASGAQAQNWADVTAAADKEGAVTLYSNLRPSGIEPLLREFHKDHPHIKAESVRLGDNPLIERFSTEFNFKRDMADVVITFPDERLWTGMDAGWALEWTPPEFGSVFPDNTNHKNKAYLLQYQRVALIWNKNLVKPEDAPKDWTDLFDAKWKGKIGFNPIWRALTQQALIAFWEDKLGIKDAASKLKEQNVRFFEGSSGVAQAVLRGDVLVAPIDELPINAFLVDGAPIGFIYPDSGTSMATSYGFVSARAPHPNAAKVLFNWLLSKRGQEVLQEQAGLSVSRTDVAPLQFLPRTSDLKNIVLGEDLLSPERSKALVTEWRTTFGVQ